MIVPSLRASAASLNFSMRLLIRSLISDGLSVVAMSCFLGCARCAARVDSIRIGFEQCRSINAPAPLAGAPSLPRTEPSMTTSPASITAPPISAGIDRGLELDVAAEALASAPP